MLPSVADPDGGMDNLPTVIMEAMAPGLPVVSTTIAGIPEMVIEKETGFLVQPGDAVALAGAIENVINDRSLAQKLGQTGYERAQRLFSIEKNVREFCAEYGIGHLAYDVSLRAARLAKAVAADFATPDRPRWVAGSLGPGTKSPPKTTWVSTSKGL